MTDNVAIFQNKYALLDTNILSEVSRSGEAGKFRPVFDFLKQNNIESFVLDITRFEFIGFSTNKVDYDLCSSFIKRYPIISTKESDVNLATLLSSVYKCCNPNISPKQISFCDCLHAAQMIKFKEKVFVVTTDIHDYPILIFDIKKIMVVEENGRAVLVAFFMLNVEKWNKMQNCFLKSGYKNGM